MKDQFTRIGEAFGKDILNVVSSFRIFAVTVERVDDVNAYCTIYNNDEALPVPLTLLNMESGTVKVTPKIGTTAAVGCLNGDDNKPLFVGISEIDKIEFERSSSKLLWSVDNEDDSKDELTVQINNSKLSMKKDEVAFNDGTLEGLVILGDLTKRLNELRADINAIQDKIASHSHSYIDSVGSAATPTPRTTTSTTFTRTNVKQFNSSDYENKKVKQ